MYMFFLFESFPSFHFRDTFFLCDLIPTSTLETLLIFCFKIIFHLQSLSTLLFETVPKVPIASNFISFRVFSEGTDLLLAQLLISVLLVSIMFALCLCLQFSSRCFLQNWLLGYTVWKKDCSAFLVYALTHNLCPKPLNLMELQIGVVRLFNQ